MLVYTSYLNANGNTGFPYNKPKFSWAENNRNTFSLGTVYRNCICVSFTRGILNCFGIKFAHFQLKIYLLLLLVVAVLLSSLPLPILVKAERKTAYVVAGLTGYIEYDKEETGRFLHIGESLDNCQHTWYFNNSPLGAIGADHVRNIVVKLAIKSVPIVGLPGPKTI